MVIAHRCRTLLLCLLLCRHLRPFLRLHPCASRVLKTRVGLHTQIQERARAHIAGETAVVMWRRLMSRGKGG